MSTNGMTYRILRMWHWTMARRHRMSGRERAANFHIKVVQLLNDVPELRNSTAERDCIENPDDLDFLP